jgi:hypothetical protein
MDRAELGYVGRTMDIYRIMVGNSLAKRSLGRPKKRRKNDTKINLGEM